MIPYATSIDINAAAAFYGVVIPAAQHERLLELATLDVVRFLGAAWDTALLDAEQVSALREATAIQAVFRFSQGGEQALHAGEV